MSSLAVAPDVFDLPIAGVNLTEQTLSRQIGARPALIVFLRHFGCIFCRESVKDLRLASRRDASFPRVIFVFHGSPEEGKAFFDEFWPEALAVADANKSLYRAFHLGRGSGTQLFGPGVFLRGLEAVRKGNFVGRPGRDPFLMPGWYLVHNRAVIWSHVARHAGDHPDLAAIPRHV